MINHLLTIGFFVGFALFIWLCVLTNGLFLIVGFGVGAFFFLYIMIYLAIKESRDGC